MTLTSPIHRIIALALATTSAAIAYGVYHAQIERRAELSISGRDLSIDTSPAAFVPLAELSLIEPRREPVPIAPSTSDTQSTSADPNPTAPSVKRVIIRDPLLHKNIKHRQSTIRRHMEVVDNPHASENDLTGALLAIANLSVFTMYDIEGKSRVIPEMAVDLEQKHLNPRMNRIPASYWTSAEPGIYRLISGGAIYEIRPGEFPEFDRIESAKLAFSGSVPIGELPVSDIVARAKLVLSYDIQ